MAPSFSHKHFKNLSSRSFKLSRAGVASLVAVMLVLSSVVLASAVSAGYLTTSYARKNAAPVATAQPSSHTFKARFLPPIFKDDQGTPATVTTEKSDYQPGEYVTVTGSGWIPGEIVNLL